jgi:uncharacterized membrane protein YfcA
VFATGFFGVGGGFLVVPTLAIALASRCDQLSERRS